MAIKVIATTLPEVKIIEPKVFGDAWGYLADQFGAPTWSNTIAALTAQIVAQGHAVDDAADWWNARSGVYHMTASDSTSWYGFASAIFASSKLQSRPDVIPIATADYPTPAKRPANPRMSNDKLTATFGLQPPTWEQALKLCLDQC